MKSRIKHQPDKAIKIIEKIAQRFSKSGTVKVGLPKGSNDYPDGTSVIMVGNVHEFGSAIRNISQRSFLRSTVQENRKKYYGVLNKLTSKMLNGDTTLSNSLDLLGLMVQTDVREKIHDIKSPALKYRVGNPLIDTGHLRQSITYEVSK